MYRVRLSSADLADTDSLIAELSARFDSVEDPRFLKEATGFAQELPRELRRALNTFRQEEPDGACVVEGYHVDDRGIGPTPAHWKECKNTGATLREEFFLFLCSCLLGDPIGWATQQDGHIMHDILPIKGHEKEQLGSGSEELLTWHTEDAFHPLRTDYIALMCLRNPDLVETTYASIDDVTLDEKDAELLRRPRYPIRPDESHLPKNRAQGSALPPGADGLIERSYEWIKRLDEEPEKIEVLFGHPDAPYLRLDPYFMRVPEQDTEAVAAFQALEAEIDKAITGHALRPGEIIFLDNYKSVHGRMPFTARFDGTDRWLKRLNIARDTRKSRARRQSADSRIIF